MKLEALESFVTTEVYSNRYKMQLVIYEFFSCFTGIPSGLSAYKP